MKKNVLLTGLFLFVLLTAYAQQKPVHIVFIGNSITKASYTKETPPISAAKYLEEKYHYKVEFANCGVSGKTTVNFLPEMKDLFPRVIKAADVLYDDNSLLVFSIKLGTNDSAIKGPKGAPVSPEDYRKNMQSIINELISRYPNCKIIVHRPIWYSPNTYNNSAYLEEGLNRLQSYIPEIKKLVKDNKGFVFEGDTKAFNFFRKNYKEYFRPEEGKHGTFYLHPNTEGSIKLGEFWAKSIHKNIKGL